MIRLRNHLRIFSDERYSRLAFVAVSSVVTIWTGYVRSAGLDPHTLWHDDVWVASLTKLTSLTTAVAVPAPVPPGFLAILWVSKRLFQDPELSLQLLPFLCSLAVIPVVGALVARVSGSYLLGIAASCLMSLNANVANYSVFVKQYTTGSLVTVLLLLLAALFFPQTKLVWFKICAAFGFAAQFLSFPSVFSSVVLVNLALWQAVRDRNREPTVGWRIVRTTLIFDLAFAASYFLYLGRRSSPELVDYWRGYFMPVDSIGSAWDFLARDGLGAIQGALPAAFVSATPLVLLGLIWLLSKPTTRPLGAFALLFYAAVVVASALRLYPVGGGRTDIFSYPVTFFLFTMGVHSLTRWLPIRHVLNASFCIVLLAVVMVRPVTASYFELDLSHYVRILQVRSWDADGIVISEPGSYLAGYYSN